MAVVHEQAVQGGLVFPVDISLHKRKMRGCFTKKPLAERISVMARTKSAAKQARASLRRQAHNKSIKSKLHTLEGRFLAAVKAQKADEAAPALQNLTSALDKAAKVGVVHRNLADRKKSRLTARLKSLTPASA
jgi:small subunit ribosomal protein S20